MLRRLAIIAGGGLLLLSPLACSQGQALRVTTSAAVKSSLKDHNINYSGDITCRGDQLPINCVGHATDGRPIAASLTVAPPNSCVLLVAVGGQQITREKGPTCRSS